MIKLASHMRSLIWNHFTVSVNDNTKAICNYSKVIISRGGKIQRHLELPNLLKHLRLNHILEYRSLEAIKQAKEVENKDKANSSTVKTLNNYVQKVIPFGINHQMARKITRVVAEMIVLDNQPFSVVDDLGFKNLVRLLEAT